MTHATYPPRRMRFSFESRCRIVQLILAGQSPQAAAAACGASRATGYRLWDRFREGGWPALADRPSTPRRQPRRLAPEVEHEILAARERSGYGPLRLVAIVERPASTIGKVLRRFGRSRLPKPERDPVLRYERERPGELLHIDTKKLGRFWVAAEDGEACAGFLERALAWYAAQGIVVERVLTDNAGAYRSRPWRAVCARNRVRRRFTRPYRPQTNGKVEALVKTFLREWAYRFAYPSSQHRTRALPGFLRWYNRRRPHGSLGGRPPISRVSHVCGHYT